MIDDEMRDSYNSYLDEHIGGVKKAFDWLYYNLPELFDNYDADYIGSIISQHDQSKYDDEEYFAYCEYFYGDNKNSKEVLGDFDFAWLHHQHNNPHHWQHWLLREDDGDNKALEMPYEYILEMICDHWSFNWRSGNIHEIFDWYKENKSKMSLHTNTRAIYEKILNQIQNKLDSNI